PAPDAPKGPSTDFGFVIHSGTASKSAGAGVASPDVVINCTLTPHEPNTTGVTGWQFVVCDAPVDYFELRTCVQVMSRSAGSATSVPSCKPGPAPAPQTVPGPIISASQTSYATGSCLSSYQYRTMAYAAGYSTGVSTPALKYSGWVHPC